MMSDEEANPLESQSKAPGGLPDPAEIAASHVSERRKAGAKRAWQSRRQKRPYHRRSEKIPGVGLADDSEIDPAEAESDRVDSGLALDPALQEQIVAGLKSLLKVIDLRVKFMVRQTAKEITGDQKFTDELVEQVGMSEVEIDTITSLSVLLMQKYNVVATYLPEALLGVCLVGYGYRVHRVTSDLKELRKEIRGLPTPTQETDNHGPLGDRKN